MPLVAEVVDAVVRGDTHRDTHALEITAPTGTRIATLTVDNDEHGYAEVMAWIAEHAPGPRVIIGLEGYPQLRHRTGASHAGRRAGRDRGRTTQTPRSTPRPVRPDRRSLGRPAHCAWMPSGCPLRAPTGAVRLCESC